MNDGVQMGPRFAKLQTLMGAWTMAGAGALLVISEEVFVGVILFVLGLIMAAALISGKMTRKRPHQRTELLLFWTGIPVLLTTLLVLIAVGFLPKSFTPWIGLYLLAAVVIYVTMIFEARKTLSRA